MSDFLYLMKKEALQTSHLYGLIGYPLSHSFSKKYFTEKFAREGIGGHAYELFPLERIEDLPALLAAQPLLCGLNVTIPYKQSVMPYLEHIHPEARAVGAVNTIRIQNGRLWGYNSDVYGFETSLHQLFGRAGKKPEAALVLGNGGAAKAVVYVLGKLGIDWKLVSRNPGPGQWTYEDIRPETLADYQLIVNTTPLGMAPHTEATPPLPYEALSPQHQLFDLIYNPEKTVFLANGERMGCLTQNGLEMLYLQAERAWSIWNETAESLQP